MKRKNEKNFNIRKFNEIIFGFSPKFYIALMQNYDSFSGALRSRSMIGPSTSLVSRDSLKLERRYKSMERYDTICQNDDENKEETSKIEATAPSEPPHEHHTGAQGWKNLRAVMAYYYSLRKIKRNGAH